MPLGSQPRKARRGEPGPSTRKITRCINTQASAGISSDTPYTAVGILAAEGLVPAEALRGFVMVGEVSLEGGIKPVHGVLSMALACRGRGIKGLLVPTENAEEAAIVEEVAVYPVATIPQVVEYLNGAQALAPQERAPVQLGLNPNGAADFSDVRGQGVVYGGLGRRVAPVDLGRILLRRVLRVVDHEVGALEEGDMASVLGVERGLAR